MINFLKKQKLEFYIFLGILLLGIFLRFYNYPYRYSLGEETVRDAVIGIEGARELQFPLTGSFSSLGPFTFGPWYAYQLIIFHLIFPFVYSPWIYLSIISVFYIFIMYKIGKILGGNIFALVLSFLVAISPTQIISATHLTSHNNTNLFVVLSIWIFLILLSKNKSKWWHFLLGFVIGVGMNLHFQMGGLLILPLTLLINKRKYLNFVFSGLGVICSFIPMLIFEANNHWFTTRNIFDYLMHGKNAVYVPNRWLFYLRDFWPSFWSDALGVPVWFGTMIIILFLISIMWLVYKKKLSKSLLFLIVAFALNFILLRYYWGPRFFGYLNFLRPFVFIFTALALINLRYKKIYIGLILLPLIVFFSYPRIASEMSPDPFSKTIAQGVIDLEKKHPNKKFALYSCSKEYESSYNASTFTTLFFLELKNKFDSKGLSIGVINDCEYPQAKKNHPLISEMLVDFSNTPKSDILKAGWTPISFKSIYTSYARWWFELQP
ncbi:MAG: glycosyltransferase family 39 protein [Candidatus Levybacteria bacterium]|nr:glycosyltransferase family 39 protein [Candidatus Levybacteria bacterium]